MGKLFKHHSLAEGFILFENTLFTHSIVKVRFYGFEPCRFWVRQFGESPLLELAAASQQLEIQAFLKVVEGLVFNFDQELDLADAQGANLVIFDLLYGGGPLRVGVTAVSHRHASHLL